MPVLDVYATEGTFGDKHTLAQDLAKAVMRWEQVPEIPRFLDNTAAFIHDLPARRTRASRIADVRVRQMTDGPGRTKRAGRTGRPARSFDPATVS